MSTPSQWPQSHRWPLWHRDNPAGLLAYVQAEGLAPLLPGLPTRAQGHSGDRMAKLTAVYAAFVCLDLSVTFAGACLHPLIVVCEPADAGSHDGNAHAVVVMWLGGDWHRIGGHRDYPAPGPAERPLVLTEPPHWPDGGLRPTVDGQGRFVAVDISRAAMGFAGPPASFDDAVAAAGVLLTDALETMTRWRWGFGLDVGLHHRPETTLAPPGRPLVAPLNPPYQQPASTGDGPLAQLRARTETVPFVDRGELDLLLGWCRAGAGHPTPRTFG
jgi:hypothetical protein